MAEPMIWRLSSWDHNVHAFRALGELVSQAIEVLAGLCPAGLEHP